MNEAVADLARKGAYALLAALGTIALKFIADINDNRHLVNIQISQISLELAAHDRQLLGIERNNETIFRMESQMGQHEKRIDSLENRRR